MGITRSKALMRGHLAQSPPMAMNQSCARKSLAIPAKLRRPRKSSHPMTPLPSFRSLRFFAASVALFASCLSNAQTPAKLDPPAKPAVSGKFVGNGKDAVIKFVTVEEHEPFNDKEAITLIFSEKDPAKAKKPSFDAMFGKLGSALILNAFHDGGLFGCQVVHSAHQKQGFTSLGQIKMVDFKLSGGNVSGRVSTGKELDTFGEKWEVDLTFAAPLPAKLRNPSASATAGKPATSESVEPVKKESKPAATGPLIAVRKLPLPKDATNVEYKAAVEQIHLSSARSVETVAKELSAGLKQQGWKDSAGSLMGKQNAILRREQGDAKLTIMVQPAPAGSTVKIFAEGLDWTGAGDSTPPPSSRKSAGPQSVEDAETEAQKTIKDAEKLLNDALKNLPK